MSPSLETGFRLRPVSNLTVELPFSKSICIRELVWQFLNRRPLTTPNEQDADDIRITYQALSTVYQYLNSKEKIFIPVHVGDCGAAYRFLMATLAITPGHWLLTGSERLLQRPITKLVTALQDIGADIVPAPNGWHITGKTLHAQQMVIDGSESSQYISALLLIAKHIGNPAINYQRSTQPSEPYITMTEKLIMQLDSSDRFVIERDWSAAIFWYAFCTIGGAQQILLKGLTLPSIQGDAIIAQWFEELGVSTTPTDNGIVIRKTEKPLRPEYHLHLINHPDLAPVLTAMATMLPIRLTLTGLRNLNIKESNRKQLLFNDLSSITTIQSPDDDTLIVDGTKDWTATKHLRFDAHDDHRLVMAYSLLAFKHTISIAGADCVKKSYPQFAEGLGKVWAN